MQAPTIDSLDASMCHRRTPLTRRGRTVPQPCSVPITEEVKMAARMRPKTCPKPKEKTTLPGEVIRLNKSPSCSCWFALLSWHCPIARWAICSAWA